MDGKAAKGADRDAAIRAIGARQLHLITCDQLLGAGFTRGAIDRRLSSRRIHRLHTGVYALHSSPYTLEQSWLAAVLACGTGALLSDWPAAAHWKIVPSSIRPVLLPAHVTVQSGTGRTRPRIVVHQRGPIDPRDVRRRDGIPVTSPELVLVHLAPTTDEPVLEQMLVAAESWRGLKRERLAELVAERGKAAGMGKLGSLLAFEPALSQSDLELLFLPVIRLSGAERPNFNHPIAVPGRKKPLSVDLAWPDLRLVVELDSQRFHGDWKQAEIDRERDQLLALAGWVSHRFVRRRVNDDPEGSAQRLRQLIDVRIAELRGGAPRRFPST